MPRNPDRRAALPSITAKVHSIKGFAPGERMLFIRVANLIDAITVAQRQIANPRGNPSTAQSASIPVPGTLTVDVLLDGLQIKWAAVEFDEFESYEVQISTTTTFATLENVFVTIAQVTVRDESNTDLFVRVRTVSRSSGASSFSATTTIPAARSIYETDQDSILPENRTGVNPQPQLIGAALDIVSGDKAFVGVGAAVGPGPVKFTDTAHGGLTDPRSQITYTLEENDLIVEGKTMGLPTIFNESESNFYPFVDSFYLLPVEDRTFSTFTGSFTDFFKNLAYRFTPDALDVRFLEYQNFYAHEQTGTIMTATYGIIKD